MMVTRLMVGLAAGMASVGLAPLIAFPLQSTAVVEFAQSAPRPMTSGFHPAEHTEQGLTFAWTRESFSITLPGLDRSVPWRFTMRAAASRPDGTVPDLVATIDGVIVSRGKLAPDFADYTFTIEPRADRPRSTTVAFRVTPPFVPAGDPRTLAAQVDRLTLSPAGRPWLSMAWAPRLALGAAAGLLVALVRVPTAIAAGWLLVTAGLVALVFTRGLGPYAGVAWLPALIAGSASAMAALFIVRTRSVPGHIAVLTTFTAVVVQLLLLFHPDMPIGDALFHAHRFQDVLGGRYFFTSLAPGNYQFPYPIGLYLFSRPFAAFTNSALENAALLRIVAVVANALAAAALFRFVMRWRRSDDVAGAAAVVAYQLIPLGFGVIATGNLTNVFAQALAMLAFVSAGRVVGAQPTRWPPAAWLFIWSSAAFLSHTSTLPLLAAQLLASGLLVVTLTKYRRAASLVLLAALAAIAVSVAVYYMHFGDVYREAWGRIVAETGQATEAAGGRTPRDRLMGVPYLLGHDFGLAILASALLGLMVESRRDGARHPGVSRVVAGWLLAALLFLVIGIMTPVDLRHFYAALPAVAVLAGAGLAWLWRAGAWGAAAAVVLTTWAVTLVWQSLRM